MADRNSIIGDCNVQASQVRAGVRQKGARRQGPGWKGPAPLGFVSAAILQSPVLSSSSQFSWKMQEGIAINCSILQEPRDAPSMHFRLSELFDVVGLQLFAGLVAPPTRGNSSCGACSMKLHVQAARFDSCASVTLSAGHGPVRALWPFVAIVGYCGPVAAAWW